MLRTSTASVGPTDPENAETRQRRASKGGKAKANPGVQALRIQLQDLTEQVVSGDLETGRGAVANQLIGTQIRLLEYERRFKDLDELVERLERLENARRLDQHLPAHCDPRER